MNGDGTVQNIDWITTIGEVMLVHPMSAQPDPNDPSRIIAVFPQEHVKFIGEFTIGNYEIVPTRPANTAAHRFNSAPGRLAKPHAQ